MGEGSPEILESGEGVHRSCWKGIQSEEEVESQCVFGVCEWSALELNAPEYRG